MRFKFMINLWQFMFYWLVLLLFMSSKSLSIASYSGMFFMTHSCPL